MHREFLERTANGGMNVLKAGMRLSDVVLVTDVSGNPLDTSSAIIDDTSIKVVQPGDYMGIFNR